MDGRVRRLILLELLPCVAGANTRKVRLAAGWSGDAGLRERGRAFYFAADMREKPCRGKHAQGVFVGRNVQEGRGKCRSSGEVLPFGANAQGAFGG